MGDDLWSAGRDWLWRSAEVIAESAPALNSLNVFPVSDADTGSNLSLTLNGVADAVGEFSAEALDAMVQAAILSAHGNSGAIVAEMMVSACRSLQRSAAEPDSVPARSPAETLARVLRTVAVAATEAVAEPVAGTILTVADAAATGAEQAATGAASPLDVATAAQSAARDALSRTPEQLAVLSVAGVVDAGGQALVLLLDVLVEVLGGPEATPLLDVAAARPVPPAETHGRYEVMYTLTGADTAARAALRRTLTGLGDSVVIVGDEDLAQVHVHLAQPGAAVEAGLALGRPSQIRIVSLDGPHPLGPDAHDPDPHDPDPHDPGTQGEGSVPDVSTPSTGRTLVAVVAGPGLAAAVTSLGGLALELPERPIDPEALGRAIEGLAGDVVLLPNGSEYLAAAQHLTRPLRTVGRRIAVIPTVAQVQGLAAMAVHEPESDFDSAVVAMSAAVGHARHGAVLIAERPARTPGGRCEAGDVLGIVDGDVVEVGSEIESVACAVLERMLASGGELLTLVEGVDCPGELGARLAAQARRADDGLETDVIDGGQRRCPLLVGVE
ncbi:MAG: DAK2 domain-containing protein [Propionibacteriaceae bacterium]